MGTLVGALIVIVNSQVVLLAAGGVPAAVGWALFVVAAVLAGVVARRAYRYDVAARAAGLDDAPALQPAG
jgi:hypothetical protein